ncbi:unnamed protein product [Meloidogyne enterolobii]|uniref:Uncharacterized protein n=1 Tax=Meloidogyne enterolobii TaxID=390850 RepID=A0ACB1AV02_MELEN
MLLTTTTTNIVDNNNNKLIEEPFQTLIGQKLNNSSIVHILPILTKSTREEATVEDLKEEKSEEDLITNKNKEKKRLSSCSDFLLNQLDDSLNALEMVKVKI